MGISSYDQFSEICFVSLFERLVNTGNLTMSKKGTLFFYRAYVYFERKRISKGRKRVKSPLRSTYWLIGQTAERAHWQMEYPILKFKGSPAQRFV